MNSWEEANYKMATLQINGFWLNPLVVGPVWGLKLRTTALWKNILNHSKKSRAKL